jgi:hypothetical protein
MANTSFSEAHPGGLRQHHHGWHPTKKPGAFTFVVESGVTLEWSSNKGTGMFLTPGG